MPRADELYGRPWDDREYALVLNAYFRYQQHPRHINAPYVQELARLLGRTPGSIVMRLENYASIDPRESRERRGLQNTGHACLRCYQRWVDRKDHLASPAEFLTANMAPSPNRSLFEDEERTVKRAFDRYELLDHLGDGGFGSVYSCLDVQSGELRAIKIIRTDRVFDTDTLCRFRREIQVLQTVSHSNVIRLMEHNLETEDRLPGFVMELATTTLAAHLEEEGHKRGNVRPCLSSTPAAEIFSALLDAVEALHRHTPQVVHRDINPGNILLMPDGRWVLADFGLAKFLATTSQGYGALTRTQVGLGTGFYAAPEQYRDLKRTDARTDVYALGIVLWELFTSGWPPPDTRDPRLPPKIAAVYAKATERDPDCRYQSVADLREAFVAAETI